MLIANVVVTSPGNPPIVGSVSFYDGTTLLGTEPVSNGVATLSAGSLSPGSHSFSTVFSGGGTVLGEHVVAGRIGRRAAGNGPEALRVPLAADVPAH